MHPAGRVPGTTSRFPGASARKSGRNGNCIRKGCLKLYEICRELDLKCSRVVWDTNCRWDVERSIQMGSMTGSCGRSRTEPISGHRPHDRWGRGRCQPDAKSRCFWRAESAACPFPVFVITKRKWLAGKE